MEKLITQMRYDLIYCRAAADALMANADQQTLLLASMAFIASAKAHAEEMEKSSLSDESKRMATEARDAWVIEFGKATAAPSKRPLFPPPG